MDQPISQLEQTKDSLDLTIVEEIASGRPAIEVASMLGITISDMQQHVSRLRTEIQQRGRALRVERLEETYASTEEKILKRIKKDADDDMTELSPLIRALEVVAKNRVAYRNPAGMIQPNQGGANNILINVNLPAAASIAPSVTLNSRGEIVAVGERNMSALPLEGVQKIFSEFDKLKGVQHEQASDGHQSYPLSTATASA